MTPNAAPATRPTCHDRPPRRAAGRLRGLHRRDLGARAAVSGAAVARAGAARRARRETARAHGHASSASAASRARPSATAGSRRWARWRRRLAHEVRNPLGAMELFVGMLAEEVADRPDGAPPHGAGGERHRRPEPSRHQHPRLHAAARAEARAGRPRRARRRRAPRERTGARPRHPDRTCRARPARAVALDRGLVLQTLLNLVRNAGEAMAGEGIAARSPSSRRSAGCA